jgi:hypothetical protein
VPLARSGVLAAWASAWLRGETSPDDAISAVLGHGGLAHRVIGLPDDPAAQPLLAALVAWRRSGARAVLAVLPAPGDLRGVPGPQEFRAAALDAGEAAVGGTLALVPHLSDPGPSSAPREVIWSAFEVQPVPVDAIWVGDAERDLAEAISDTASALAAAQSARWRPERAAALAGARAAADDLPLPAGHPQRAVRLLAQAERLAAALDLAGPGEGGDAVDLAGAQARIAALRPLVIAVRRARLAAYNAAALAD